MASPSELASDGLVRFRKYRKFHSRAAIVLQKLDLANRDHSKVLSTAAGEAAGSTPTEHYYYTNIFSTKKQKAGGGVHGDDLPPNAYYQLPCTFVSGEV